MISSSFGLFGVDVRIICALLLPAYLSKTEITSSVLPPKNEASSQYKRAGSASPLIALRCWSVGKARMRTPFNQIVVFLVSNVIPNGKNRLRSLVMASVANSCLIPVRITTSIHFKPYTEEEFVEIVINVLDREEGVDRDIALLIADGVYNRLKSTNIRECVRIARLAKNERTSQDAKGYIS
jgi:hypothetical protein